MHLRGAKRGREHPADFLGGGVCGEERQQVAQDGIVPLRKELEGGILELVFLILCATFITYFLIPVAQKNIRPTLVSMYSYVQPIIAIVISIYIGMDTLTWQKVLAAVTVFGGVLLVNYSRSQH